MLENISDKKGDKRLGMALFLCECNPEMGAWYKPLITFGCNSIEYLKIIAEWDESSAKDLLRMVMAQPVATHLTEADLVFLLRNLAQTFVLGERSHS